VLRIDEASIFASALERLLDGRYVTPDITRRSAMKNGFLEASTKTRQMLGFGILASTATCRAYLTIG